MPSAPQHFGMKSYTIVNFATLDVAVLYFVIAVDDLVFQPDFFPPIGPHRGPVLPFQLGGFFLN